MKFLEACNIYLILLCYGVLSCILFVASIFMAYELKMEPVMLFMLWSIIYH